MAVRSGVIDYRGRLVDARAFVDSGIAQPLTQQLVGVGDSGAVLTGIVKLVQRVALELLTDRGSMPYLPERGTLLMPQLRAGAIRTSAELFAAFSLAASDVVRTLRNEASTTTPADERLQAVEMVSAQIIEQLAVVRAFVISDAGESREVYLPLTVSPAPVGV